MLATGAALAALREVMAPFALAVFLWLMIDGFADAICSRSVIGGRRYISQPVAKTLAVVAVAAGAMLTVMVIADSAASFADRSVGYVDRLDAIIAGIHSALREPLQLDATPPTMTELFSELNLQEFLRRLAIETQGVISNGILICIYVAFLFAAENSFKRKMGSIFARADDRAQARETAAAIRDSVEQFVWVQTWTGAIPAAIAYVVLKMVGLDNALFWAFLIFLVSYVPTIGPIVATVAPSLFALVQFEEGWRIAVVVAGVAAPLFVMGNIVQPRFQGESMNLSTVVVLLGLAIWGEIWGIPGMFLSSPLMVAIMVVLAHIPGARWLAVLMSADGRPDKVRKRRSTAPPKPASETT